MVKIIMIGPGGLLLVVSYLSAVIPPGSVFLGGVAEEKVDN
jgi:hypothetical protein